ncbi:7-deoxyloganetin glucosyltransferase-like [Malania oleifera]|uniref:7-deoxyloganetin glucosyltransferase-like n=1 Tax=Malania oleifera TaxID=397392 RepID=UPI0025AE7916|nr:7-deoxyloganetin glucosyltransferase-like [Malania oleifera]
MAADKPHAVCTPFPFQSHIKQMMNLAKLLHHRGFHITFVNTEFNHRRLLQSRGPNSLDGLPDFQFATIPDGLPPSDSTPDIPSLCDSVAKNFLPPFRHLLSKSAKSSIAPPVTCLVSDGFMSFTHAAAAELGVPNVILWTISPTGLMGFRQHRALREKGFTPLKDSSYFTNGYLDITIIDWIPGMKDVRLRDLPSFLRTTDPNDILFEFCMRETEMGSKASAMILNTFDELEPDVLEALSSMFPPIYTIGPLHLLINRVPLEEPLRSIGSNLLKEELECLQWLDSKKPNSVLYVNFGSTTVMAPEQLIEFAWGLAGSNCSFLWVIRPGMVSGDSAILQPEFEAATGERGLIESWCPQEEVLNHPATGGFLTHGGWNSMVESLSAGVPVICWPFFAEQPTNCRYACREWGIGMEIGSEVKREEVEKIVREVMMKGEKGKGMKKRVMELKEKAHKAVAPNGSSFLNLEKVVKEMLSAQENTVSLGK